MILGLISEARELSVSHEKFGNVLSAQGNLPGALESYRADLAITDRLAKSDPGNAGWQRDLAVSYLNLALTLEKHGNRTEAFANFRPSGGRGGGGRR